MPEPTLWSTGAEMTFPELSTEERDRRWGRVRQLMAGAGVECLLVPAAIGGDEQANSRYLSQIGGSQGGAWVVFPAEGEVMAIVSSQREARLWQRLQHWITDVRFGDMAEVVTERVRELKPSGLVGVSNLKGMYRFDGGTMSYETWDKITRALAGVRLEPQNSVLEEARMIKGPEEIAIIERVTEANEQAIEIMFETARPDVPEATVWTAMTCAMVRATGDMPARLSIAANRDANSSCAQPLPEKIPTGAVMHQEIAARLAGYQAQSNHSFSIGRPAPDGYAKAMSLAVEVFEALVDWIRPGRTIGELVDEYVRLGEARAAKSTGVVVHTNGLGADRPRLGPGVRMAGAGSQSDDGIVIQPGFTFTMKPTIRLDDGSNAQVGDPVTVTERGARRLGHRKLAPVQV